MSRRLPSIGVAVGLWLSCIAAAQAQPIGLELHNTMMPAAGGMGGASIARPQEVLSSINGNPATMTQFDGNQFQFAGGFAYANYDMNQTQAALLPGVGVFNEQSAAPGSAVVNIGMNRRVSILGADANVGFGLISNAGAAVDFRGVPASNGTSCSMLILEMMAPVGVRLTDRLSIGANVGVGTAFFDGPFVGNGAMVSAYGLRCAAGTTYDLTDFTTASFYWQSKQNFNFEDAISLQLFNNTFSQTFDVRMDLPTTYGLGLANQRLLDGNLLLAIDLLYKEWSNADLYEAVYRNQWALQFGTQYSINRLRLRAGYVYAQNPMKPIGSVTIGGITPPGGIPALSYTQALLSSLNQNRISFGVGMVDVMPGLDFDLFAGGMLSEAASTGPSTTVRMDSWYVGGGATFRFGRNGVRSTN